MEQDLEQQDQVMDVEVGPETEPGSPTPAGKRPPERSRKVRRYQRRSQFRAKTIALRRLTKEEIRIGREVYPPIDVPRPTRRAECEDGVRP